MDPYFLIIITLIIVSIFFILYIRISAKISDTTNVKDNSSSGGEDDSARYDSVLDHQHPKNSDPLSHLKSSNYPNHSDFTLLE